MFTLKLQLISHQLLNKRALRDSSTSHTLTLLTTPHLLSIELSKLVRILFVKTLTVLLLLDLLLCLVMRIVSCSRLLVSYM